MQSIIFCLTATAPLPSLPATNSTASRVHRCSLFRKVSAPLCGSHLTSRAGSKDSNWSSTRTNLSDGGADVAIAVSVTRDVADDVRAYIPKCSPAVGCLVEARPTVGVGVQSVTGADHAIALADKLADLIRSIRPRDGGTAHLFIAAPNAVMFFLGQHRAALGKIQLYEFDFEGKRGGSYSPSLRLPK